MDHDYEKYRNNQIAALGFIPGKLTSDQKDMLLEPVEAPENYHMDGEVSSPAEAKRCWVRGMISAGFNTAEVTRAAKALGL